MQIGLSPKGWREPWQGALWDSGARRRRPSVGRGRPKFGDPARRMLAQFAATSFLEWPHIFPSGYTSNKSSCRPLSSIQGDRKEIQMLATDQLGSRAARSYNVHGLVTAFMQILDLRQIPSRRLEPLFQEETRHWRDELHWDYRPSVDLIRKFIDSHSLGGYVAIEHDKPAGYGFYVLEDHKGLIGGLFVSSGESQAPITKSLVTEMFGALRATPRLQRVEAQLMPFGTELDPAFLSQYFNLHTRLFMLLPLAEARLSNKPISSGLRLEPWTDKAFESAARLIQLAYADHVDSEINDQYCSES